jgi:hypothetical protein
MSQPPDSHDLCLLAREEAAVALLTRRRPADAVLDHLQACPPCHQEYQALAALPDLLDAARPMHRADPPPPPDPHLLDRLLVQVARHRRRRRTLTGLALVAAAAAVIVPVIRFGWSGGSSPGAAPAPAPTSTATSTPGRGDTTPVPAGVVAVGVATAAGTGVSARVEVRTDQDLGAPGSVLTVSVRGLPPGQGCRMLVHDTGGGVRDAGGWTADPGGAAQYTEEVPLRPSAVTRVVIVDDGTGRPILDVPVVQV